MTSDNLFKFIEIIMGTPWWVWAILAYLIFVGIKSTHNRILSLPKLFIIPAVLVGSKYKIFGTEALYMAYLPCMFVGAGIGFLSGFKTPIKILKHTKSVELHGDYQTLILLFLFFSIKYVFGFLQETAPESMMQYSIFETAISALFSGYFLGRATSYLWKFVKYS